MMVLLLILVFIFGVMLGAGSVVVYSLHAVRNQLKIEAEKLTKKAADDAARPSKDPMTNFTPEQKDSIMKKLREAAGIAQIQMEMLAQLDLPSKNALHSKYKNELRFEIQDLENKKIGLLKAILAEGLDPAITILNDQGKPEEMLLSKYLAHNQARNSPPTDPNSPNARSVGKFTVIKGGKDDGKGN
jgi:hypothetical protein